MNCNDDKKKKKKTITFLLIIIGLIYLGYLFYSLIIDYQSETLSIISFVSIGLFVVTSIFVNTSNSIKPEEMDITLNNDNTLHIKYGNYEFDCKINDINSNLDIPNKDLNGNSISRGDKIKISNYLKLNYDTIVSSSNTILIKPNEVKDYYTDLIPCNDEIKKKILLKKYSNRFNLLGLFSFIITIYIISSLSSNNTTNIAKIYYIILFIIILATYLFPLLKIKNINNTEVYSKKVSIFDSKVLSGREYNDYYIRVCDEKKQVLNKWLQVDEKVYDNCKTGTLYIILNNNIEFFFIED